ncbi:MAG: gamma-glutamyl-gamma-aminobutyrate hydrolase family protein [Candidatus Dormibacteria bacterium]
MDRRGERARPVVLVPTQAAHKLNSQGDPTLVQALNRAYLAALQAVGLTAVLLPTRGPLPQNLSWVSGLVLPGGPDVDPLRYGQDLEPATDADQESDQLEFALLDWALAAGISVLAICRGLQVLNVGLGGTLSQDLPRHAPHPGSVEPWARDQVAHQLRVERGSRLREIVGAETIPANSLHHQGIDRLAPGLSATAFAPDGLIEGAELTGERFVLGVQYHPEELFKEDQAARAIFEAFALACRHSSPTPASSRPELVSAS